MLSRSPGRGKPTEWANRRRVSQASSSWVPPAPSMRTSTCLPRQRRPGSWASEARMTVLWSATVFDPALPLRSRKASGSPLPAGPWSTKAHSGWKPNPRLNVGAAHSFSEWALIKVASTSITSGREASMSWSGACSPANCQGLGTHPGTGGVDRPQSSEPVGEAAAEPDRLGVDCLGGHGDGLEFMRRKQCQVDGRLPDHGDGPLKAAGPACPPWPALPAPRVPSAPRPAHRWWVGPGRAPQPRRVEASLP